MDSAYHPSSNNHGAGSAGVVPAILKCRAERPLRESEILIRAELPGVRKKDLEVKLSGNRLTIRGETHEEKKESEEEYYRSEIMHSSFSRSFDLPEQVSGEGVKADFKDGMLTIHLPKEHKTERRNIPIE